MHFLNILLFVVTGAFCFDGMTFKELKELNNDTATELEQILRRQDLVANCEDHPSPKNPKYLLYNRDHEETPIVLTSSNLDQISSNKEVIVIIPGWLTNSTTSFNVELKDAYLKRYDCNLIIIDWSEYSFKPYTYVYCSIPRLGLQMSKFICQISRTLEIPASKVHVVGHSLGAQIASYVGLNTVFQCDQQIGRITGLDPAGPIYKKQDDSRLSQSDAIFVDVIHTDSKLGIVENCGHVDFHPNCVDEQPGCPDIIEIDDETRLSDCNSMCGSFRSMEFMAESVNSNQLIAVSCSMCSNFCEPDIITEVYTFMGEECREVPDDISDNFLIYTRESPPYGQGMLAYP